MPRVLVIGGGPTGLAAALRIRERAPELELTLLEASERLGGLVRTERTPEGFVIERGPESMITDKPWGLENALALGLEDALVRTKPENRGAWVLRGGELEPIPPGFAVLAPAKLDALRRSGLLSMRGFARAALEPYLPGRREVDAESLAGFVRRRYGDELLARLAQPMAGGIYGADPEQLDVVATLPRFHAMEEAHGSVTRGLEARALEGAAAAAGARYGLFVSFAHGMSEWTDAMAAAVGESARTNTPVDAVETTERGVVAIDSGGQRHEADALVLAVPSRIAAGLVPHRALAAQLRAIRYGSAGAVTLGFDESETRRARGVYGFVVPADESRGLMAATFSSEKWPGRAPAGASLLRFFVGGFAREGLAFANDETLVALARREAKRLLGIDATPALARVDRFQRVMPRYHVGHRALVRAAMAHAASMPRVALAGNAYAGVGLPDSVRSGRAAADRILDALER